MEKLKSFLEDFKGFKDKRLRRRFSEAVQRICNSEDMQGSYHGHYHDR